MNKLIYVSDISFPNTSAQAIQILKMCDEFSNKYKLLEFGYGWDPESIILNT